MGVRYGQIKPDVYVSSFEPADDGHLRVGLTWWKRKPSVADMVFVGHLDDENRVAFADVVAIEGECPMGTAFLKVTGGPYELDDVCDYPLDW